MGLFNHVNESPFNVGEVIHLQDFTKDEVRNAKYACMVKPLKGSEVDELVELLRGQPYLTQRALYDCSDRPLTVQKNSLSLLSEDSGPFSDHLRYHLFQLVASHGLARTFRDVINHRTSRYDSARS